MKYKVVFGKGQIKMIRYLELTEQRKGMLLLTRHEEGEIGRSSKTTVEDLKNAKVALAFDNIDGLEILIEELQLLKSEMLADTDVETYNNDLTDYFDTDDFIEPPKGRNQNERN